jgi:hypothetical protein
MVNIDGAFLVGVAAILTSLATLWRTARDRPPASMRQTGEKQNEKLD